VVVSDMVAPGPKVREAFDGLHRHIDPSHMRVLLSEEIVELVASEVGPICGGDLSGPTRLLIDQMLTDASNRVLVKATLSSEINGGDLSGFDPRSEAGSGGISVSFTSAIVHASKAAPL
jgi:hypothetical protein